MIDSRKLAVLSVLAALVSVILTAVALPLVDPDEGRNAEVAREIREAGDGIIPRFHGLPYLDKPVLYFDLVAGSFALFGRSEGSARLPSILFGVATLAATWGFARRIAGGRRATTAVAVLASSPLFVLFARTVIFDMALTFFVTVSIWLAEEGRLGARWARRLAWVAIALAVLTKGPVGLLLPVLAYFAWVIGRGGGGRVGGYFDPIGILLFVLCVAPWVWTVERREPGFLHYAILTETVERLTRSTFHRSGPFWYYAPILLLGIFPWSLPALARLPGWVRGARDSLARPSVDRGLFLAFFGIVLLFSISKSKLGGYVLPSVPLLSILLAGELERISRHRRSWTLVPGTALSLLGLLCLAAVVGGFPLAKRLRLDPGLEGAARALFLTIGIVCAAAGSVLVGFRAIRREDLAPFAIAVVFPAIVIIALGPLSRYAEANSSRRVAEEIRSLGGEAIAVRCFPVGLDYYLDRVVPVVTDTGREITSTYVERAFERVGARSGGGILRSRDFEALLASGEAAGAVFITRREEPPAGGYVLQATVGRYRIWKAAETESGAR